MHTPHSDKGGLEYRSLSHLVMQALTTLKKKNQAERLGHGEWQIKKNGDVIVQVSTKQKTIGKGNGSVYLYCYPTYRLYAESQNKCYWACKLGMTRESVDSRVFQFGIYTCRKDKGLTAISCYFKITILRVKIEESVKSE